MLAASGRGSLRVEQLYGFPVVHSAMKAVRRTRRCSDSTVQTARRAMRCYMPTQYSCEMLQVSSALVQSSGDLTTERIPY